MSHLYNAFESTALWNALDAALTELQRNRDIELSTSRELIIGFLCKQLSTGGRTAPVAAQPDWVVRGKTVRGLIKELQSFENQDLEVRISMDSGLTQKPISLVSKRGGVAMLSSEEQVASIVVKE